MITQLQAKNFKSWRDTGPIRLAPLTGLFGANSSGKTAILQMLLMLKQTIESPDPSRVLNLGDDRSPVDLGTFTDVIYRHQVDEPLNLVLAWELPAQTKLDVPGVSPHEIEFDTTIRAAYQLIVEQFAYRLGTMTFGMRHAPTYQVGEALFNVKTYLAQVTGYDLEQQIKEEPILLSAPIRFYGFPNDFHAYYPHLGFLSKVVFELEKLFDRIFYLGPLREYPRRIYTWAGSLPRDVGREGGMAVQALLGSAAQDVESVLEPVATWLKNLGLIYDFSLKPIAEHRRDYEVRVKKNVSSAEVLITDVGFGVSQILPVLVLCYYVPEGSTIILEQPEIHLHPSVQAGLADVFIDAMKIRNVQIILESHSEHLLRRLQRRIAEEMLPHDQAALYFVALENGESALHTLEIDLFGNITNWPPGFFGDEMEDLVAMTEAEMRRRQSMGDTQVA
jgi:hypothetical protein